MNNPDGKTCWAATKPIKKNYSGDRRDDVFLMVSIYPDKGVTEEVSIIAGYEYDKERTAIAKIGSEAFEFFIEGNKAWLRTRVAESKMVAAMKAGSDVIVTGHDAKGDRSMDEFSLLGFTKAYRAALEACS